jgi:hypothetical protein
MTARSSEVASTAVVYGTGLDAGISAVGEADADVVGRELAIGRDDREPLQLYLRDQQSAKGIAMMLWKRGDVQRMSVLPRQRT